MRSAGFVNVLLRGDSHFSLPDDFDYWTKKDVHFVFGLAAHPKLVEIAEGLEDGDWRRLRRDAKSTGGRRGAKKTRVKRSIIEERGYKHLELDHEDYTELSYRPTKFARDHRLVVLRKTISVKQRQALMMP